MEIPLRISEGRAIPPIAEAQHVLVRRHDVENYLRRSPSAERSAGRPVLDEADRPQLIDQPIAVRESAPSR